MAAPPPPGQGGPQFMMGPPPGPGQQPSPEQIAQMQRQLAIEAQKRGITVPQYVEQLKQQAMRQHQMQQAARAQQMQQQQQGGPPPQQQVPINPGPPKPEAIAVANFLRSQDLKQRTCIFQEKRKDMFKVKRAIRALHSPAYEKARSKNPLLPPVTDRVTAENVFKLLPLSLLALRVSKVDPHEGHDHAPSKKKRVKGLWTVKVEQQQEAKDEYHYVWLYEGSQWKMKLYALGALLVILAVILFPLWPYTLRVGVWYLSMACLGLLGLFFAMAIFRLILFVITMFVAPPGLWLYPNLFEDVGFFDSFRPVWGWQETEEMRKEARKAKKARKEAKREAKLGKGNVKPEAGKDGNISAPVTAAPMSRDANTTGAQAQETAAAPTQRPMSARVEEVEDDE
ncbi:Translocation protein S62 [Zalaria obscura]|uniref:Translocation protein S62 n=1 Tax=Zalaria obscura TaxID=2024903 RepID=A0ACC3S6S7_9PEZI